MIGGISTVTDRRWPHRFVVHALGQHARPVALGSVTLAGVGVVAALAHLLSLGSWPTDFGLGLERAVLGCLFGSGALVMSVQTLATKDSLPLPLLGMSMAGFVLSISGMFISMAVESNPGGHLGEATETGLWLDLNVAGVILAGVAASVYHRPRPVLRPVVAIVATTAIAAGVAATLFGMSWILAWWPALDLLGPSDSLTAVWATSCVAIGLTGSGVVILLVWLRRAGTPLRPSSMVAAAALAAVSCLALAAARTIPGTGWRLGHALLVGAAGAYFIGQLRVLGGALSREALRIRQLTLMQAAARDLSSTLDLAAIRRRLVRHGTGILSVRGAHDCLVRLIRVRGDRLVVVEEAGAGSHEGSYRTVALAGQPTLMESWRKHSTVTLEGDPFSERRAVGRDAAMSPLGVAPIVVDGDVTGFLTVAYQGHRYPAPAELESLTSLAHLAGVAFSTAWSFRDESSMVARLRTLAARSAEITSAVGLDETLIAVLQAACQLTASASAEIAILTSDHLHLDRHVAWTYQRQSPPRLVLDPPVMSADPLPVTLRTPFRLADMPPDGEALADVCRRSGIERLAGVPLLYQGATLGTLYVMDRREQMELDDGGAEYDDGDAVILSALAVEAAVAIENARMISRLEESALLDPLTGLPNQRAYLRVRGERPTNQYVVLAIDVDNLKIINDEGGHECGDAVLRTVGEALRSSVGADSFVARIGGDEFVVVLYGGSVATTDGISRRIQRFLYGSPVPHGHARLSIGAAQGPATALVADTWRAAESMLVRAKAAGGDCIVWQPEHFTTSSSPMSWDDVISATLAPGGLRTVFQPVVRLRDGCVVGMEALARPTGLDARASVEGLFAAAQRLGRMRDLDWACRRRAIEAAGRLPRGVPLFLNVSAGALCDPMHPVDQMELLLTWASLRPQEVVLEITERERINDSARLQATVALYRDAGFRFAVDDLGEGHGSMATLVSIAPEFQKLAKAMLVRDDPAAAGLIAAVVGFSKETGGSVIAEGVEDPGTIPWLMDHGVDLAQGFGICRPMEAAQVADVVRRGRVDLGHDRTTSRRRPARHWQDWRGDSSRELAWPPRVANRRRRSAPGTGGAASVRQ